jgi:hypothetical protein
MKCVLMYACISLSYFPHLFFDRSKFGFRDLHAVVLRIFEFRENRRRKFSTFLKDANEITFPHAP